MKRFLRAEWVLLAIAVLIPILDLALEAAGAREWRIGNDVCQRVLIFAIMGLGLNVVVGFTGLLHLGVAAFMAIGVYAYAILTCTIYPYQIGFWAALLAAPVVAAGAGLLLGAPTLRLRGDYLAIVTLGFGEITQDVLKNIPSITKGTQGINPLPPPALPGYAFTSEAYEPWYFLYLAILVGLVLLVRNLENSRLGRQWMSIREDELAATCMGINPVKTKLMAFAIGAALCGFAGVLWASKLGTTAEPTSYDFNISITVLALLIVGGLGSIRGVLAGAALVMGFDILLQKSTEAMQRAGLTSSASVYSSPTNWKYLAFGLALVLMMRFRPEGIFPSNRMKEELHDPGVTRVGIE
jgi:branched-chain amino acid transport system permease protein